MALDSTKLAQTGDSMFAGELDPVKAQDYFAEVEKTSIVQRVARKVPMGPTGVSIPHWNGNVSAQWVEEGEAKPLTKGSFSKQVVTPHKIAAIFVASAEVVRANPHNYLATMKTKVAEAFALAFDAAVLHGTNTKFGAHLDQTTKKVSLKDGDLVTTNIQNTNAYQALGVTGLGLLVGAGKKWNGTLLDDKAEPFINGSVDSTGRPLFVESTYAGQTNPLREGSILGRQTVMNDHVATGTTLGYMGDFSQIIWGQVGGLSYDVTDQATLPLNADGSMVSLWQNNLVAVRVEAEFAALVNDPAAFVKITSESN